MASGTCGAGIGTGTMGGGSKQRGHQACAAMLRLCEDGTVNYLTGATDCGQGSDTVLVQIIAEELGLLGVLCVLATYLVIVVRSFQPPQLPRVSRSIYKPSGAH